MTVLLYVALELYHVILLYTFQLSYRHPGGHVRMFLKALKHSCHHQDSKAHLKAPVKVCVTVLTKPHGPPNRRCGKSEAEASLKVHTHERLSLNPNKQRAKRDSCSGSV